MAGSVFKRCGCTKVIEKDDGTKVRRQLGRKCPKLKRPDGAWNPRHGTWTFMLPVVGVGGVRRQVARGGFASKEDAQDAMDAMKAKAKKGVIINDRQTVGEYLVTWLKGKKDIKANTIKLYRGHINRYWLPHIGHIRLVDLRVAHVAAVFEAIDERNELVLTGRLPKRVRFVSDSSKQRIRSMLRTALNDAIRAEDAPITVNVAALVKLPSGKSPKPMVWTEEREERWNAEVDKLVRAGYKLKKAREMTPGPSAVMVWRADHTGRFLDHVMDHPLYAMWYMMVHRGPRRGEVCGLEWSDCSLRAKYPVVTIERQVIRLSGQLVEDTPKSDAGGREIALGVEGAAVLRAHRVRQAEQRLAWGEAWVDSGKVYTHEDGSVLNPDWVSDEFERICRAADLPMIRLHDLRHGAATLMLAAGVDMKVVQETLGHSNMATTSNTYTSVYPEVAAAAADATHAIVPRAQVAVTV